MVPLTESVYVPGSIPEPNKLLIEMGTELCVEKTFKDTTAFLDRELKFADVNSKNISKSVQATRHNIESMNMTMQGKMLKSVLDKKINGAQSKLRHKDEHGLSAYRTERVDLLKGYALNMVLNEVMIVA
jgi:prefoldin subunit 5